MRDNDGIAEPLRQQSSCSGFSLIWLAPLFALAVSLGVAWNSWSSKGPLVELILESASGIEIGKTVLKHKDVEIGKRHRLRSDQAGIRAISKRLRTILGRSSANHHARNYRPRNRAFRLLSGSRLGWKTARNALPLHGVKKYPALQTQRCRG